METLRENLKKANLPEKAAAALLEIVEKSDGLALLLFGSFDDGETWEHSDIDLFLISNLSKKHSAFMQSVGDTSLHINVCSESAFRAYLNKPTGRTIHALFVNGNLLLDKTDWIKKERQRLSAYPLQNKVLQVCERLEKVLHQFYQMKKEISFRPMAKTTVGPSDSLLKLFEAEQISAGVYYGKSVLKVLGEQEHKLLQETERLNDCDFINKVQPRVEALVNDYLPLLMTELQMIENPITNAKICESLGIDLDHLLRVAKNRELLEVSTQETNTQGFPVEEMVYISKCLILEASGGPPIIAGPGIDKT